MADFESVRGMQMPPLELQLTDAAGVPIDLTTATLVQLRVTDPEASETPLISGNMDVFEALTGKVRYNWQPADVDRVGYFFAQAIVTWQTGKRQAFPGGDYYLTLEWTESLGV